MATECDLNVAASQQCEATATEADDCNDEMYIAASQLYELYEAAAAFAEEYETSSSSSRFEPPVSNEELLKKIEDVVPKTTKRSTEWAATVWLDWLDNRQSTSSDVPPSLDGITTQLPVGKICH